MKSSLVWSATDTKKGERDIVFAFIKPTYILERRLISEQI